MAWWRIPLLLLAAAGAGHAGDLPRGQILEGIKCEAEPTQTYTLYLPSHYTADRTWALIMAFDPGARGRVPVERYQAAAEKYGYIIAGSNNSRNGSIESSMAAVKAMSVDLGSRFSIDAKRIYTAGMSGGARVAMAVALGSPGRIAGVIASSAGWPDGKTRKTVPFVVFGTAGTEDFNYLEMRQLDAALTSPHHVAIFDGGHTWLSSELAMDAVEWLEIQAMKAGTRPREELLVEGIYAKRLTAAAGERDDLGGCRAMGALAVDFQGLKDVANFATRAELCRNQKPVKDALKKDSADMAHEMRLRGEIASLEESLHDAAKRNDALSQLREKLTALKKRADAPFDTVDRRQARRILRNASAGMREGSVEPGYRKLFDDLGIAHFTR